MSNRVSLITFSCATSVSSSVSGSSVLKVYFSNEDSLLFLLSPNISSFIGHSSGWLSCSTSSLFEVVFPSTFFKYLSIKFKPSISIKPISAIVTIPIGDFIQFTVFEYLRQTEVTSPII